MSGRMPAEVFDTQGLRAMGAAGWVPLTRTEWRIMAALWERRELDTHARDLDGCLSEYGGGMHKVPGALGAVKVHICNIRRKLGDGAPIEIESSRQVGYRLRVTGD